MATIGVASHGGGRGAHGSDRPWDLRKPLGDLGEARRHERRMFRELMEHVRAFFTRKCRCVPPIPEPGYATDGNTIIMSLTSVDDKSNPTQIQRIAKSVTLFMSRKITSQVFGPTKKQKLNNYL